MSGSAENDKRRDYGKDERFGDRLQTPVQTPNKREQRTKQDRRTMQARGVDR